MKKIQRIKQTFFFITPAILIGCHMSQQPENVREDKSNVPTVSIQPVGTPVPVTVENAKLEKTDHTVTGHGTPNQQNISNTGDKE